MADMLAGVVLLRCHQGGGILRW